MQANLAFDIEGEFRFTDLDSPWAASVRSAASQLQVKPPPAGVIGMCGVTRGSRARSTRDRGSLVPRVALPTRAHEAIVFKPSFQTQSATEQAESSPSSRRGVLTLHLRRCTSAVVIASIVRSISLLCDELAVVCEGRDTVLDRYVLSHTRNKWYRSTQNFNVYEFQCVCVSVLACVHVYPSRCL